MKKEKIHPTSKLPLCEKCDEYNCQCLAKKEKIIYLKGIVFERKDYFKGFDGKIAIPLKEIIPKILKELKRLEKEWSDGACWVEPEEVDGNEFISFTDYLAKKYEKKE